MSGLRAELHIHSCLSPCADDDMTPADAAGMARLAGADVAALTDHNSAANCPAFFAACEAYGVVPVGGMELTTAEEIHLVCLFPTLAAAMDFDRAVRPHRMCVKNRPEVFGRQILMDAQERPCGEEPFLLPPATDLPLEAAAALVAAHGGAAYPAHIDRPSGGLLAILGGFPPRPRFAAAEVRDAAQLGALARRPDLAGVRLLTASDAHRLHEIGAAMAALPIEPGEDAAVRQALIALLGGG